MLRFVGGSLMVAILAPAIATASPMFEPARRNLMVEFENGDRATISCRKREDDPCALDLRVNGRAFHFDSASLGAGIGPGHVVLYSGLNSGRDKYFSFGVSVACPEEVMLEDYDCEASVLVQQGKPHEVDIHRRKHEDFDYQLDPNPPPKAMTWDYTLTSPSKAKLEALIPILTSLGYGVLFGVQEDLDPWTKKHKGWELFCDRDEDYTAAIHALRKREFADLAAKHDVVFERVHVH